MKAASASVYDSPRLAAGYAFARPAVHVHILAQIGRRLGIARPCGRGLDIGCGAGLSTAALQSLATRVVGLEPVRAMLAHRRSVAPGAEFVAARAERLPFAPRSFDLVTAAGSLNYADRDAFLPELARVLAADGVLAIYDFSAGRRLREGAALREWYAAFERRYPPPPGYAFDVEALPFARGGLTLVACEPLEVAVAMRREAYVAYAMSETSVELALSRGCAEDEIRSWCEATLSPVFGAESRTVLFDASIAYVKHRKAVS